MLTIGGSKRGNKGCALPREVQVLSISCSFGDNLAKLYVGIPPGGLVPPPRGNPGSVTANTTVSKAKAALNEHRLRSNGKRFTRFRYLFIQIRSI